MRFPDSAGLLLALVDGFIQAEEILIQSINNYQYPFGDFVGQAQANRVISIPVEDCSRVPRLYMIAGHKDKISHLEQAWSAKLKQAFEQFIRNERIVGNIKSKVKKLKTTLWSPSIGSTCRN